MPTITGTSHVDLTVSDLDRSIAFYQRALNLATLFRGRNDAANLDVAYLAEPASGMVLGLVRHAEGRRDPFNPRVTGLDHLSFAVSSPAGLAEWAAHLDAVGIPNTGVTEQPPFGAGLNFTDPDGIALEFYYLSPAAVPAK